MMVLVSYDVSTADPGGARRLRRLARACLDYGQRVQFSVFEIEVDSAQWTILKARLMETIDPVQDSLRFYYLGRQWRSKVEHVGAKPVLDLDG
ncbi:CRISPR-associated endonuclease Cas2 [Achromobacter sp. Marseille-Q4962]|uniref:CRISPR-associated endonuclease Cas2 n=1 Tax=Achromobacter sp. Marseille-Q4962 TaxID=2942202 RepID=UPI002072ACD7|nr:CRISPR-associated endonuclease Cas2 [Achromobacter sp. Marseille-Q4962]